MYINNPLMKLINKIGYVIENKETNVKFALKEDKENIIYTVTRMTMTMYSIEDNQGGKGFMSMKNVCNYVNGLSA